MEHYQPEFVTRYLTENAACTCPACQSSGNELAVVSIQFNNQQRDSLEVSCESAARQLLLNPQAFVLHAGENSGETLPHTDLWLETLNQQCLNLAMHPSLNTETALYAIGILLSKAQQYQRQQQHDPALLVGMAEEVCVLANNGVLADQYNQLPQFSALRAAALKTLSALPIDFTLPLSEKMTLTLKISELMLMNETHLVDRVQALGSLWEEFHAQAPAFVARNILIYQIYQNIFPGRNPTRYGSQMLHLTRQFFQLNNLFALWLETGNPLTDDVQVSLFSSWYRSQCNIVANPRDDDDAALLEAFALI